MKIYRDEDGYLGYGNEKVVAFFLHKEVDLSALEDVMEDLAGGGRGFIYLPVTLGMEVVRETKNL